MPSYSVWLEPRAAHARAIARFIERVRARVDGAPAFAPHVTVIGAFDAREGDARDAFERFVDDAATPRDAFALDDVGDEATTLGATRHRCAYRRFRKDARVMATLEAAKRAHGTSAPTAEAYEPHLSLAYGVDDATARAWIREEADAYFKREGRSRGIECGAISLWETDAEDDSCASWRRVATRELRDAKV